MNNTAQEFPTHLVICLTVGMCLFGLSGCTSKANTRTPNTRTGKVIGPSMAPAFVGGHFSFKCLGCDSKVLCGVAQAQTRANLVCPYCGDKTPLKWAKPDSSELVTIHLGNEKIRRWAVVAFDNTSLSEAGIKRVVGLPNESLEIRDGDIFVNQKVLRKSLEVQRKMRILVHDSKHVKDSKPQWIGENAERIFAAGEFRFPAKDSEELDWLSFQCGQNYSRKTSPNLAGVGDEKSIEDNYGYNQSLSRKLNPMDDVFIEFEVDAARGGQVAWRLTGSHNLKFTIDFARAELKALGTAKDGLQVDKTVALDREMIRQKMKVEFSSFDRQFVVSINGLTRFEIELDGQKENTSKQFGTVIQIGGRAARGEELLVAGLKIWRDIYYLPRSDFTNPSSLKTEANEFILLGDNVPISEDSRHWEPSALSREKILGIVKQSDAK